MKTAVIALLIGVALGVALSYWLSHLWRHDAPETFRPGRVQVDGSVDLTRIPTPPADAGPPAHELPKGATETSRAHLVVQPKPVPDASNLTEKINMGCSCEPITIDLSHYTSPGGTGIVASSPDANVDVHESTYTPLQSLEPPQYRHFVHLSTEPGHDNYAAIVGRRYLGNRVGVGLGVSRHEGDGLGMLVGVEVNW